ncbi:MAG TPA: hypothetical protein DCK95_00705 [Anaerolineaceae bacterium]|nr:hypothetical protein [Anaerolineaceae bacterium]
MPLDFINLQDQVNSYSQGALFYQKRIEEQTHRALEALEHFSSDIESMRERAERTQSRVALPASENPAEPISAHSPKMVCNLISVDGSQIVPDPHIFPFLALINIGIVQFPVGEKTIKPITRSKLYKYEELFDEMNLISEDVVNIDRDVKEMEYLKEYSLITSQPTIALRDGMLELYHEPRSEKRYRKRITEYNTLLNQLKDNNVVVAGYVDKPRSRSLVTLLELCTDHREESNLLSHAFPNITDTHIFSSLLKSKQRSAIFENRAPIQTMTSNSNLNFPFYFFYLNVSQTIRPWVVRVEIPDWVAVDQEIVNLLHHTLLEQCAIMGSKPYPYCLHRAHETAVVHNHEKEELINQITSTLIPGGVKMEENSYKQAAKDLAPRTRMEQR